MSTGINNSKSIQTIFWINNTQETKEDISLTTSVTFVIQIFLLPADSLLQCTGPGWLPASFSSACSLLHRPCCRRHVWKRWKGGGEAGSWVCTALTEPILGLRCAAHIPTRTRTALEQSYTNGDKFSKGDSWTNHVTVASTRPSLRQGTEKQHGITRKAECTAGRARAACLLTFNVPSLFLSTQNNNNYHFICIKKKIQQRHFQPCHALNF